MPYQLLFVPLMVTTSVAGCSVFRWKRSSRSQRVLTVLLLLTAFTEILETWLFLHKANNLWLSHIYTLMECVCFLVIFYLWKSRILHKRTMVFIGIGFTILWVISKFSFEPIFRDDTYTSASAKIIEISMAIWILFDVLKDTYSVMKNDERAWISSGIIIYSAGTLILFASLTVMPLGLVKSLWIINWVLSIIATLLYARGIWCRSPR